MPNEKIVRHDLLRLPDQRPGVSAGGSGLGRVYVLSLRTSLKIGSTFLTACVLNTRGGSVAQWSYEFVILCSPGSMALWSCDLVLFALCSHDLVIF